MPLLDHLARFFEEKVSLESGDRLLVAFSGGPDSTALLWGLQRLAPRWRLHIEAAHLDHGLDSDSKRRSAGARQIAMSLGVPFRCAARRVTGRRGIEASARAARYAYLEEERQRAGARYVLTAHHRDDQAETVLLRILYGSSLDGLSSIAPARGSLLRPLLDVSRDEIELALKEARLQPIEDPTNRDLLRPRNRIRHLLLPALESEEPTIRRALARLASTSLDARLRLDARLDRWLQPQKEAEGLRVLRARLEELPLGVLPAALRFLHRRAGTVYPPSKRAQSELQRQLHKDGSVGCHCGNGWAWKSSADWLRLSRDRPKPPPFTYTLKVPGSIELSELGLRIHVTPSQVLPWMFRSSPHRAALALPLGTGERVTIRSRRPGDRIQPFGWERYCRVKELLINRRVPREQRAQLPFLCHEGEVAWIPGVTISERCRISSEQQVWVAEIDRV